MLVKHKTHTILVSAFMMAAAPMDGIKAQDEGPKLSGLSASAAYVDFVSGVQSYYLHKREFNDNRMSVGRAFLDSVASVICEWKEEGRAHIVGNDGITERIEMRDVRQTILGCVEAESVPENWQAAYLADFRDIADMTAYRIVQDYDQPNKIYEISDYTYVESGHRGRMKRVWDISSETVCLETAETQRDGRGLYSAHFVQDWGCFAVKNKSYFDNILQLNDISSV